MTTKYSPDDLAYINDHAVILVEDGVSTTYKSATKGSLSGHIDTFENACLDRSWLAKRPRDEEPQGNPVDAIRANMGFANYNLNTVEIYSDYELVASGDHQVKLLRYYPRQSMQNPKKPAVLFIHGGGWKGNAQI